MFDQTLLIDEVIIALKYLTQPPASDLKASSLSGNTDLELVSTFVAKALLHDVKITALPMPY